MSNPYQPHDPYGQPAQPTYDGSTQAAGQQFNQHDPYGQQFNPQAQLGGYPGQPFTQPQPGAYPGQQPIAYGGQGYYAPPPTAPTQRPVGISILAVLNCLGGGLVLIGGLAILFIGVGLTSGRWGEWGGLIVVVMALVALIGVLGITVGVGLWRMRPWAHITAIILQGLSVLSGVTTMGGGRFTAGTGAGLLVSILILVYLLHPRTQAAFRR